MELTDSREKYKCGRESLLIEVVLPDFWGKSGVIYLSEYTMFLTKSSGQIRLQVGRAMHVIDFISLSVVIFVY